MSHGRSAYNPRRRSRPILGIRLSRHDLSPTALSRRMCAGDPTPCGRVGRCRCAVSADCIAARGASRTAGTRAVRHGLREGREIEIIIRLAEAAHAPLLPAVERSAGEAFRAIDDLAWVADTADLSVEGYAALIAAGAAWVATDQAGTLVGFLCGEGFDDELHIWELAVNHASQRAGLGKRLLDTATSWAAGNGTRHVTLTTFREVAWNEPFYQRAGFRTLPDHELGPRLDDTQGLGFGIRDDTGQMIAAAAGYSWARTSELKQMWVDEAHRGRGHARVLLDAFIDAARRRGVRRIWVQSHDFQAPAFYEKAGFERVAAFDGWPDGHSNVILRKTL